MACFSPRAYLSIEKQDFEVLAAVLRTSIPFQNNLLRGQTLERLKIEYPSWLHDWDRTARDGFTRVEETPSVHFEALNLCRELHIYSAIPAIMYHICAAYTMVSYPPYILFLSLINRAGPN